MSNKKEQYKIDNEKNLTVAEEEFSIFKHADRTEQIKEAKSGYINVDEKIWNTAYADSLTLKAEEPVNAQQLYGMLSPMLQEVLTNRNTDIPALVKRVNDNFQKDFLDKNN